MENSLMLLLKNWCDLSFLGDNGEQYYSLSLKKIAKISVNYNASDWFCLITVNRGEIAVALTDGTGGSCRNAVFMLAKTGAEEIIEWCISNFSEVYQE